MLNPNYISAMKLNIAFILFFTMLLISCHKSDRDKDKDLTSSEDVTLSITALNDVFALVDQYSKSDTGFVRSAQDYFPACAKITKDTNSSPVSFTVDFGTSDCASTPDAKNRKGKVIVEFFGNPMQVGSKYKIKTADYSVNNKTAIVAITVTNKGKNTAGNILFALEITEAKINSDKNSVLATGVLYYEWTAGSTTVKDFKDDTYTVTGNLEGLNSSGGNFNASVLTGLKFSTSCETPSEGSIELWPNGLSKRVIKFANSCSTTATVSLNGVEESIEL